MLSPEGPHFLRCSAVLRGTSILRTEFVELDMHFAEKVVVVRRTSLPFGRISDMDSTVEAMARALPEGRRKGSSGRPRGADLSG